MRYYYRYQTPEDIILLIDRESSKVATAAYDHIWLREQLYTANPGTMPLTGDFAHILFEAIAGRNFWEDPKCAEKNRGLSARYELLKLPRLEVPWSDILDNYKGRIYPFFQMTMLTKDKRIVTTGQQWQHIYMSFEKQTA